MLLRLVILNFNNEQIFATINDKQPNFYNLKIVIDILNLIAKYDKIIKIIKYFKKGIKLCLMKR